MKEDQKRRKINPTLDLAGAVSDINATIAGREAEQAQADLERRRKPMPRDIHAALVSKM